MFCERDIHLFWKDVTCKVIPFSTSARDFAVLEQEGVLPLFEFSADKINIVYIGAFPVQSFLPVLSFFIAFLKREVSNEKYRFYFIGTNYATGQTERLLKCLLQN